MEGALGVSTLWAGCDEVGTRAVVQVSNCREYTAHLRGVGGGWEEEQSLQ